MSNGISPNLPLGAFITTLGGRRCTAVPRNDVNTQSSTTSTFSLSSSTSAVQVLVPPPAVQTPPEQTPTPAATVAPAAAAPTPSEDTSVAQFTSISSSTPEAPVPAVVAPQPQTSEADSSVPVLSTTTTPVNIPVPAATTPTPEVSQESATPTPPQSEVLQTDSTSAAPFTTIGLASGLGPAPTTQATSGPGSTTTVVAVPNKGGNANRNGNDLTVAVAGGVIGGVALISLIAFLIWFFRRRAHKRRRSTLLTPLSAEPTSPGLRAHMEKRGYQFSRSGSIGPTPRSTKVKAALRAQYGRVRGRFNSISRSVSVRSAGSHSAGRSVDMNRGNSQFMDSPPIVAAGRERQNSSATSAIDDADMSIKERIMELWARFTGSRGTQVPGDDRNDIFAARGLNGSMKEKQSTKSRPLTNKPDFLTLLNMDDSDLDREAQRRRVSRTRGGSEGSGLGALRLSFGATNPFSDVHALTHNTAKPAPLVVSGANNPFSDDNAIAAGPKIPQPSSYVHDIRRSRGQSVGGSTIDLDKVYDLRGLRVVNEDVASRPPSEMPRGTGLFENTSYYVRDSATSVETFATKRDKFRSDPFDLEQLSSQVSGSIPGYTSRPDMPSGTFSGAYSSVTGERFSSTGSISTQYQQSMGTLPRPAAAHMRKYSENSSKYTSGVSSLGTFDEWSDPGPDVGPAAKLPVSRRSSGAAEYNPYSSQDSQRSSVSGTSGVGMGYAM